MDIPEILSIPICTQNMEDFWSWNFERNGILSVKSAYRMLVVTHQRREAWLENVTGPSTGVGDEPQWKNLWKIKVPRKIRMFLWRLSK